MANQADVTVGIGGDPRGLRSAFAESRGLVSQFARTAGGALGPFNRALKSAFGGLFSLRGIIAQVAGGAGLGLLITSSVAAADEIAKTADRVGIGIEALQEYQYAANLSGVSNEELAKAFAQLNRNASQAANGLQTYQRAFDMAGVSLRDNQGNLKSNERLFDELADAIARTTDATRRADIVMTIFGRSGVRLLPLFKNGAEGIRQMRQEAREMGVVLDAVMVREAEQAGDQLERVGKIIRTNVTRAVLALTPQIISLGEAFATHLQPFVNWMISKLPDATATSDELRRRLAGVREEAEKLSGLSFDQLLDMRPGEVLDLVGDDAGVKIHDLMMRYRELNEALEVRLRKEALLQSVLQQSGQVTSQASSKVTELREALQFEIDQLGRSELEQRLYNEAKRAGVAVNDEFRSSIVPLLEELEHERIAKERAANQTKYWQDQQAAAASVFEQTRTPLEKYQEEIGRLNALLQEGFIAQDTYNRGILAAQENLAGATKKTKETKDANAELNREMLDVGQDLLSTNAKSWQDWATLVIESIVRVADTWWQQQQRMKASGGAGGGGGGDWLSGLINLGLGFLGGGSDIGEGDTTGPGGAGISFTHPGGPRAGGGSVVPGKVYPVGEREMELFAPGVSGRVYNRRQVMDMAQQMGLAGGGGGGTSYNFNGPLVAVSANNPAAMARFTRDQLMMDFRAALMAVGGRA